MKILYVATERGAAVAAARTLRGTAQNVTLTWTETSAAALKWIQYNRDAGAVIVDADTQTPGCNALLERIRHLGIAVPLAVIAPEHLRGLLLAFNGERDAALADERERTRVLEARLGEIEEWRRQAQELLAEERTGHDAALARTGRICTALQERLFELEAAVHTADRRHAAQAVTIERLADREAELCAEAAEAMAARTAVEHQLAEAAAAGRQAHQRAVEALAEAGERYAAVENRLALEIAARTALEDRLAAGENARQIADRAHATELAAVAARFAEREARHDASTARANRICTGLQERLLELEDAIRASDDRHTAAMAAAETARQHAALQHAAEATSLTARLADLESQCDAVTVEKGAFQQQLRDTAAALEDARRERIAEAAAASERLTLRESELGASLSEATAARVALEATLAAAESAHQAALQHWQSELAGATEMLARRETELGDALAAAVAARAAVEYRLTETEAERERAQASAAAALEDVRRERIAEAAAASERLTLRESELGASVSEATAARQSVEATLAAAESAHQAALQRWQSELAGATEMLARRETELGDALAAAVAARAAVEYRLTETEAERERAQASAAAALEDVRRERIAEAAAASERLTLRESELGASVSEATAARQSVEATLAAAESAHQAALQHWQSELAGATEMLARRETELGDALAAADAARAAVERRLVDAEAERKRVQGGAAAALTAAEERHALNVAQLHQEAEVLRRHLDTMRAHAAALRRDLEQVPALQRQLEESLHENRRQFERAPYGLCECTRDGAVTRVNHSLARLLGYRSGGELQRIGFGDAIFESADDLRLLLERAVETGKLQSVETLFKTRDSGHLNVRLHALSSGESLVIAVEDLTKLCAVEQRLREAHRMEAVGRVASEVAVTCDTLLRDVTRGGQRWLAGLESDTPLRHQGELLLDDVTRAAGYLRQFVAYGNKAIGSLEPVSVALALREMEPVLRRVVGSGISLSLPKPGRAFEVDVESETVQRIFVNVANYARERMPHGGRMKIDLATTVVDQRFLARHPEVRPGAHVLVKVTEVQGTIRGLLPIHLTIGRAAPPPPFTPASDKPGMDLGPLMTLISDLGGHLWVAAEPGGNLTLEIRLPARTTDRETAAVPGSKGSRSRQFARWFRH